MSKIIKTVGFCLLALILLAIVWVFVNQSDEPFRYSSFLTLKPVTVPRDENAFPVFSQFTKLLNLADFNVSSEEFKRYVMPGVSDLPVATIEKVYQQNKTALSILHSITQYNRFQIPGTENPVEYPPSFPKSFPDDLPYSSTKTAQFVVLDALYLLQHGQTDRAYQQLFDMLKLGYLLRNAEPAEPLIEQVRGVSTDKIVLVGLAKALELTRQLPQSYQDPSRIARLANYQDTWINAMRFQATVDKGTDLDTIIKGGFLDRVPPFWVSIQPLKNFYIKENEIKNLDAKNWQYQADQIASCQLPDIHTGNIDAFNKSLPERVIRKIFEPGWVGYTLFYVSPLSNFKDTCTVAAYAAAAQVLLALKLYSQDHGKLPDVLSALVPSYMPAIPVDPYGDGQLIRYNKQAKVIYSIGYNRLDNGGTPGRMDYDQPSLNIMF